MGYLTVDEIAEHLGVGRYAVGLYIADGKLTAHHHGVYVRVTVDEYLNFLRRHLIPAATSDLGSSHTMSLDTASSLTSLPNLHPLAEVAALVRRSPDALKGDLRQRRFAHVHIGNQYLFTDAQVEALVKATTVEPEPEPAVVDPLAATRARVTRDRARRKNKTTADRAA